MAQPRSTASSTDRAPHSSMNPFARFMYAATSTSHPVTSWTIYLQRPPGYNTPKAHSSKEECDMKLSAQMSTLAIAKTNTHCPKRARGVEKGRGEGGGGYEVTGAEDVIALGVNDTLRAHDGGVHGARRHLELHCRIPAQIALRHCYPIYISRHRLNILIKTQNLEKWVS